MADLFWKAWRSRYLFSLTQRKKWLDGKPEVTVGSVVLLRDKNLKRNQWCIARIDSVIPSRDKLVRKVNLTVVRSDLKGKVTKSKLLRPVNELVLLFLP